MVPKILIVNKAIMRFRVHQKLMMPEVLWCLLAWSCLSFVLLHIVCDSHRAYGAYSIQSVYEASCVLVSEKHMVVMMPKVPTIPKFTVVLQVL